jgi:hypothetical protein
MFPTVLDVNNIHCLILFRSIGNINFDVIKTTLITNKSLLGLILSGFTVVLSNDEEKIKILSNHT